MRANLRGALLAAMGKGLPIPPHTAAYIALAAAERIAGRPGRIGTAAVILGEGGEVGVAPPAARSTDPEAAESVRRILGEMLEAATEAPAGIVAASEGIGTLLGLRAELEATLAPLDRTRARRVLDRFLKDALRGVPQSMIVVEEERASAPPDAMEEILEDLSVPFSISSEPPAPRAPARPAAAPVVLEPPTRAPAPAARKAASAVASVPPRPAYAPGVSFPDVPESPRRTNHALWGTVTVLALGIGIAIWMRPDLVGIEADPAPAASPETAAPGPVEMGTLTVESDPPGADVLLRVRRGEVAEVPSALVAKLDPATDAGSTAAFVRLGRAPDARIDLPIERPATLRLVLEGFVTQEVVVAPSDWVRERGGRQSYRASVTLRPIEAKRRR